MSATKTNTSFYLIWRDIYLKRLIRNQLLSDVHINIDLDDLDDDGFVEYFSTVSTKDRLENRIFIRLEILDKEYYREYLDHPHRHIINELCIEMIAVPKDYYFKKVGSLPVLFDWCLIPEQVQKLSLYIHPSDDVVGQGRLHDGLIDLFIGSQEDEFNCELVDGLLLSLPPNLQKLSLPSQYEIKVKGVQLPSSLHTLDYECKFDSLKNLIVPSDNHTLKDFRIVDIKLDDLQYLGHQSWINDISLFNINDNIEADLLPSHIKYLSLKNTLGLRGSSLPRGLESLTLYRRFNLDGLPTTLKSLAIFFGQPHNRLFLPQGLVRIEIYDFDQPLNGLFSSTSNLESLRLDEFNHNIQIGDLPNSLTTLKLQRFNQPLPPFVLPRGLKNLIINRYNHSLEKDTIPPLVSILHIGSFCNSYSSIGPLDCLKEIEVYSLDESLGLMLGNVKKISIMFRCIQARDTLRSCTSIQNLTLCQLSSPSILKIRSNRPLPAEFLPGNLRKLKTTRVEFEPVKGVIPDGCVFLETDIFDLSPDILPLSIKRYKYKGHYNV
ncbi:hypothetical protein CYY_001961 [Polysphondylium violaceum]|uniref:Uncharacterized protein n=1 Tax=Polysphondylium violaceum TaxID=133409 RepID=A0A8J4Q2B4_9MYCE|nr:hypothetical protein CYY_001961 [Polysphondylium violaceum]